MAWLVTLLITVAINVVAYLIMPKPKQPKPEAARDGEAPTASANQPVKVVFGTLTVREVNVLWNGDMTKIEYEVDA